MVELNVPSSSVEAPVKGPKLGSPVAIKCRLRFGIGGDVIGFADILGDWLIRGDNKRLPDGLHVLSELLSIGFGVRRLDMSSSSSSRSKSLDEQDEQDEIEERASGKPSWVHSSWVQEYLPRGDLCLEEVCSILDRDKTFYVVDRKNKRAI